MWINYGDVICVNRGIYDHYGVYSGYGNVIHYTKGNSLFDGVIRETSMAQFLEGSTNLHVCNYDNLGRQIGNGAYEPKSIIGGLWMLGEIFFGKQATVYSPEDTVARARSCIGLHSYDLLTHNCEHFAAWCKTGVARSEQVNNFGQDFLGILENVAADMLIKSRVSSVIRL